MKAKGLQLTRHRASFAILCVPLLFASYASAEEAADRAAIGRVIAALNESSNEPSQQAAIFTADGNAASELALLRRVNRPFRIVGPSEGSVAMPTVTISKEPWGEARINFPPAESRTANRSITFITSDVAMAEGACTYLDATSPSTPLLFVMKREGRLEDRVSHGSGAALTTAPQTRWAMLPRNSRNRPSWLQRISARKPRAGSAVNATTSNAGAAIRNAEPMA